MVHSVDLGIEGIGPARLLARGGSANVYRAEQLDFGRDVAVKVLFDAPSSEADYRRFDRECRAVGAVSHHPNIVVVHGRGLTAAGLPYLVMEYRSGGSLADRLAVRGRFTEAEVVRIGHKIADAMAVAHAAGVLHRDVKPGNIMLSAYDEPALGDFGIARMEGGHKTTQGVFSASVAHASREVLDNGPPTPSSDVYSLASTLFELVTGKAPFVHDRDETVWTVIDRVMNQDAPDPTTLGVSPELARVIRRGMDHDPASRHASAGELAAELQALIGPVGGSGPPARTTRAPAEATLVEGLAPAAAPAAEPAPASPGHPVPTPTPPQVQGPGQAPVGAGVGPGHPALSPSGRPDDRPRVAAPNQDRSSVIIYSAAVVVFLAASAGGIFMLSRLTAPEADTDPGAEEAADPADAGIDADPADGTDTEDDGSDTGQGADRSTGDPGPLVDDRFGFRVPSAEIGPLSAGDRYPVELSPSDVPDATFRLVVDGEPVGERQDGLPVYFAAEGRHRLQLEIEDIDGVVVTEEVDVYVTGGGPEKGYRANLAAVRSEPASWPGVLAEFDRLVAAGHADLELSLSTREETEGLPFWNIYVDGFGDDLDAGRAYCTDFGLTSDECFVALVD